jgi:hypothetical protein
MRTDHNSNIIQNLINKKDLKNISTKFDVKGRVAHRDQSEFISLSMALLHHQDSVVAFKNQGHTNPDFQLLYQDDFLVAYAHPEMIKQSNEFLKQDNSLVAIDATHGLNTCDFKLIVLMTVEYSRRSYPISFAISNREDGILLNYYFQSLKNVFGQFKCGFFMSDDANQYYYSFVNVMYPSKINRDDHQSINFFEENYLDFFGDALKRANDEFNVNNNKIDDQHSDKLPRKLLCSYHVEKNLVKNTLN